MGARLALGSLSGCFDWLARASCPVLQIARLDPIYPLDAAPLKSNPVRRQELVWASHQFIPSQTE
jgi:hypothetical protein